VLALQECPSSGDGKYLFPKLAKIGLSRRVGSHARYFIFRPDAKIHDWASVDVAGKRATFVCATVDGRKRVYVNAHPVSGTSQSRARTAWAQAIERKALAWAKDRGVPAADVWRMGDFNGNEYAVVAKGNGAIRATSYARIKSALTRTYNAWGAKHTNPGGRFDYALGDKSKKSRITKAKTFFTPKASDHNPVFVEIKE